MHEEDDFGVYLSTRRWGKEVYCVRSLSNGEIYKYSGCELTEARWTFHGPVELGHHG